MTDHPHDFASHEIKALSQGRKNQLRAILDWQPGDLDHPFMMTDGSWHVADNRGGHMSPLDVPWRAGDRIWAREHYTTTGGGPLRYLATDDIHELRKVHAPAAMPRSASRLTLAVTAVRIERLQDISERDALREGVEYETADPPFLYYPYVWPHSLTAVGIEEPGELPHAVRCFAKHWDLAHGAGSFACNPWVAVLEFEVFRCNIDDTSRPVAMQDFA